MNCNARWMACLARLERNREASLERAEAPMRIGENIVVTYTEALGISLEKAEKKSVD
jgi:hypothetical protein